MWAIACFRFFAINTSHKNRAVFLDVDGDFIRFFQAANRGAALADDRANFVGIDGDRHHARRKRAEFVSGSAMVASIESKISKRPTRACSNA